MGERGTTRQDLARFGHNELAPDASESAAYPQQLRVKINVGPMQGERFAAAQPRVSGLEALEFERVLRTAVPAA